MRARTTGTLHNKLEVRVVVQQKRSYKMEIMCHIKACLAHDQF